ncbi:SDR family oxidoreductase [Paenibacillus sp. GCM10027628]|uniref:SDR family oxidoreductase n=1 Tax=Paenibacillus sp. GCM10027628 TaxID=3273413 RepID=UPI00362B0118
MNPNFTGKVVIVTGASRGIGSSIAELFASHGAKVVVNYSSSAAQAEEVISRIKQQGGEATAIQADISRVADVDKLFKQTIETYRQVDIVVNNAGIIITKPIASITEEDFDRLFAINVKGTYFMCQQAALHMNANGRIINFSTSVTGTKGAVEQFTRQLAKEFGPKGITINAVAPGPVNTELFKEGKTEQQIQGIVNLNAFGRLGEPDDITGTVLFLASEEARWITGQTIRVNGGYV